MGLATADVSAGAAEDRELHSTGAIMLAGIRASTTASLAGESQVCAELPVTAVGQRPGGRTSLPRVPSSYRTHMKVLWYTTNITALYSRETQILFI